MGGWVLSVVARARRVRALQLAVIQLRFLLGFAFLPAGLKKLLDQPFTDPANHGRFHDFLHGFHATGGFYQSVGAVQLVAATLLLTQHRALLGALVALPVLTAIMALCWSTAVYPTATVATLMWLGTLGLVLWDVERWHGVLASDGAPTAVPVATPAPALGRWPACGLAILIVYLTATVLNGGVYRPRGVELARPAFWLLIVVPMLPVVTGLLERRRRRRGGPAGA